MGARHSHLDEEEDEEEEQHQGDTRASLSPPPQQRQAREEEEEEFAGQVRQLHLRAGKQRLFRHPTETSSSSGSVGGGRLQAIDAVQLHDRLLVLPTSDFISVRRAAEHVSECYGVGKVSRLLPLSALSGLYVDDSARSSSLSL